MKIEDEIRNKWDYPNADELDWNDAKDDIDRLLIHIKELEDRIKKHKDHSWHDLVDQELYKLSRKE